MTSSDIRQRPGGLVPALATAPTPPGPYGGPTVPVGAPYGGGQPPGGPTGPYGPGGGGASGPGGRRPGPGRGLPIVLGVAVVVLVAAVLALSFTLLNSDDDGKDVAARDRDVDAVSTTTASTTTTSSTTTAPPATDPPPQTAPPQTAPPATDPPPQTAPPQTAPPAPVGSRDELEATLVGYVNALDLGSLDDAYSYVGPGLAARDGWSRGEFVDFWAGRLAGATVVSIDSVSTSTGTVSATVDYHLAAGGGSREAIRVVVGPDLLLSDYEVVSSSQL